ncbi:epidermal growth factor receptor kinase substrate 8 isoform X3 [Brienomyrus brachyistius]|uniref:epidermal growth factor receptor kinase substrate 8 isoform X3 n=1 Tax=Brienomyrus brachyistius TaxID=42636 RepID=UPI0020B37517|nr:epidermal growth factor receptor kinase substrate 8 isoform X3 [Brienomyrus brachyistius]
MYWDEFRHDEPRFNDALLQDSKIPLGEPSSQNSIFTRPSGKFIYRQRKEFGEFIQRQPGQFQHRVEHLLICELDGREVCTLDDCVTRLQMMNAKGQVWGQEMTLVIHDNSLQMIDIETKEILESLALGTITDTMAVLGRCVYSSLLLVVVQTSHQGAPTVFLFQCEETGADYVRIDLERVIKQWWASKELQNSMSDRPESPVPKSTMTDKLMEHPITFSGVHTCDPSWSPNRQKDSESFQDIRHPLPQWHQPDYENSYTPPATTSYAQPQPAEREPPLPVRYTETERNVDILNHLLGDLEIFMGRLAAVLPKVAKNNMKNMMKKKKKSKAVKGIPPQEEYISCLHKVKFGFNLLGKLNGLIQNPSAQDFVHSLFSILSFIVPHYPSEVPPTIVAPLLTEQTIRLLSEEATAEEDQLWQSLGDAWNIPSSAWPDEDTAPPYTPEFTDGWQPPSVVNESQATPLKKGPGQQQNAGFRSSAPISAAEGSSQYMRAMYDFTGRNDQELSVLKGDVLQVLDQSKQWWKVRNDKKKEGYVPNNLLEYMEAEPVQNEALETWSPAALTKRSKPEDVKAWLEGRGFSPVTVRCLSVLNGSLLLGMTWEELKTMCPDEGGRVFSQLQAVKTALV